MLPRQISKKVLPYLLGDFPEDVSENDKMKIENLCRFTQFQTALQECRTNEQVYPSYYAVHIEEINREIDKYKDRKNTTKSNLFNEFDEIFRKLNTPIGSDNFEVRKFPGYFGLIRNLKYLRRWNLVNRSIESSVLGHTYLVALLALIFSWMEQSTQNKTKEQIDKFTEEAILRALFHDVAESLTGDLITPLKDIIKENFTQNDNGKTVLEKLEEELAIVPLKNYLKNTTHLKNMIGTGEESDLLQEISNSVPGSVSSLVKDSDHLALVLECIFEKASGRNATEMVNAFNSYLKGLQNSEWHHIREFCDRLAINFKM